LLKSGAPHTDGKITKSIEVLLLLEVQKLNFISHRNSKSLVAIAKERDIQIRIIRNTFY
jgi:hypothetical protein